MNIVIIGIGKVGLTLVDQLFREDHNIIVIDREKAIVEKVVENFDVMGVVGNGADYDIQNEAKMSEADLLIACTSMDELNILCCMVGKKLGVNDTIARVRNPEYYKLFLSGELGLELMVNPEYEGAMEIFRMLRSPGAILIEPFADGKVDLVEFKINKDNPMCNLSVSQIMDRLNANLLICAVQRGNDVFIPNGNSILLEGDKVYITASSKGIYSILKDVGIKRGSLKNIIMIGGGKIAFYLAKELESIGIKVKIIEKDEKRCITLKQLLKKAEIIWGDASEPDLLIEEGLKKASALVVLTGSDEVNILISLFAIKEGLSHTIAKVDRTSYEGVFRAEGVDSIVSPRLITANQIIRYVRAKQNSQGSAVLNLYKIVNNMAEALEFIVTDTFIGVSKPLKELNLVENLLIANILRDGEIITPHGEETIERGDKVIVVTTNRFLKDLNDILK